MYQRKKKRATPGGITLLAKPHPALGSLSSVATILRMSKSTLSVPFHIQTVNVQLQRRNCSIYAPWLFNFSAPGCSTPAT